MTDAGRWSRTAAPSAFDLRRYRAPRGYVRVSTDEQAEEGTSIESQIQQIQHFAQAYGVVLTREHFYVDDGWSGKDLNRPAMARLRADARSGLVDCVLVTKLDRLSRNLRDMVNLCLGEWQDEAPEGRRVVLKSISEPFDTFTDFGRMVFGLLAMFAEFERRRIAERTWSGKAARAEAGRNAGHRPPYGFRLVPAPDGRGTIFAVVPEEAAVIRRICELYRAGAGDRQIALRLNEEGCRFRGGRLWQAQHVARVLTNPIIAGIYAYGRTTGGGSRRLPREQWLLSAPGQSPPAIIAPEEYAELQQLRAQRHVHSSDRKGRALLTGLLRCGRCGSACGIKRSGPGGRYRYYRCLREREAGPEACGLPPVRADELESQVVATALAVLGTEPDALLQRLREAALRRRQGIEVALAEAEQRLADIAGLRRSYFTWLEQGRLQPEAVQARLEELAAEEKSLRNHRMTLSRSLAALEEGLRRLEGARQDLPPAGEAWAALSEHERRHLLRLLVQHVEVDGRHLRIALRYLPAKLEFLPPGGGRNPEFT